jgi:hypothetical protein
LALKSPSFWRRLEKMLRELIERSSTPPSFQVADSVPAATGPSGEPATAGVVPVRDVSS